MKGTTRYSLFIATFVLLLLLSTHGVVFIPAWSYRGLDLQNLHVFHHQCPGWPIPYDQTGAACGDPLGRPLLYPPLIYWVMAWTRFFSFYAAELLWSIAIPLLTLLATYFVDRADSIQAKMKDWAIWFLAFFQMPMVYAIERGNNDAAVLPIYALGVFLIARKRWAWAGVAMAAACWMKVYPVIPSFLLLVVLAAAKDRRREEFIPFLKGFTLGGLALLVAFLPDSTIYLFRVLPSVASEMGGFGTSSHTLFRGMPSLFLKLPVLVLWGVLMARTLRKDPVLILTAGLAISTFFQNLSNDYNLITAYPFLFLVLKRILRPGMDRTDFGILLLTFAAFLGDRTPLEILMPNRSALFLQILWFVLFPVYLLVRMNEGRWQKWENRTESLIT